MNKFHFDSMLTPLVDLTPGEDEWVYGLSAKVQYTFENAEEFGIEKFVEALRELFEHENYPWDRIPLDHPVRRADVYFERLTGKPWKTIKVILEQYGEGPLATRINGYINPEWGNQHTVDTDIVSKQKKRTFKHGNEESYTLNRLRREAPKLFERVIAGELSANKAAIEAGFRKPTKTVPVDSPEAAVKSLLRVFTREQLIRALSTPFG